MNSGKRKKTEDWETSSYTQPNDNCVDVHRSLTAVRDSKMPDGGAMRVTRASFTAFTAAARAGYYEPTSGQG